jgi:hypothetical protein
MRPELPKSKENRRRRPGEPKEKREKIVLEVMNAVPRRLQATGLFLAGQHIFNY